MSVKWTEEHDKIVENYERKFYHFLYRFEDHGFETEPSTVWHGGDVAVEIIGRDH